MRNCRAGAGSGLERSGDGRDRIVSREFAQIFSTEDIGIAEHAGRATEAVIADIQILRQIPHDRSSRMAEEATGEIQTGCGKNGLALIGVQQHRHTLRVITAIRDDAKGACGTGDVHGILARILERHALGHIDQNRQAALLDVGLLDHAGGFEEGGHHQGECDESGDSQQQTQPQGQAPGTAVEVKTEQQHSHENRDHERCGKRTSPEELVDTQSHEHGFRHSAEGVQGSFARATCCGTSCDRQAGTRRAGSRWPGS
jgi:hypothetical protein